MAESVPAGAPRAKGGSSTPFWKSLTSRKKSKDAPAAAAPGPPTDLQPPAPSDSRENQQPSSGSRRNLTVSRSGRFKERRRCRCALPTDDPQKLFEGADNGDANSATTALAVRPGGEAPCQ